MDAAGVRPTVYRSDGITIGPDGKRRSPRGPGRASAGIALAMSQRALRPCVEDALCAPPPVHGLAVTFAGRLASAARLSAQ
jgi:hypothetical protein